MLSIHKITQKIKSELALLDKETIEKKSDKTGLDGN